MKATKPVARYTPAGTRSEHCGICVHFDAPRSCERVQGVISEGGWCRFFARVAARKVAEDLGVSR